jgi:hypothetical protein
MVRTLGIFTRGGNGLGAPFKSFSFRASLGLLPAGSAAASRAVLKGARLRIRLFQRRGAAGRGGGGGGRGASRVGGGGAAAVVAAAGRMGAASGAASVGAAASVPARRTQAAGWVEVALRSVSRAGCENYDP